MKIKLFEGNFNCWKLFYAKNKTQHSTDLASSRNRFSNRFQFPWHKKHKHNVGDLNSASPPWKLTPWRLSDWGGCQGLAGSGYGHLKCSGNLIMTMTCVTGVRGDIRIIRQQFVRRKENEFDIDNKWKYYLYVFYKRMFVIIFSLCGSGSQ